MFLRLVKQNVLFLILKKRKRLRIYTIVIFSFVRTFAP